ncbi:hypothetical protein MVES1_003705 [Malassezia vespertilionis]|uniref:Uncharacterized protein n=1 Tax=Malassezia vespertilionis TaxID=2020962 RepID=A0A2N1J8E2_9BASI|nr:uncharacterized protein MVES1_003705 [Malassezia vespertilionis]PKI82825.1 hypothetical protein MVES_003265 [Malassezia vespertilionis]WFD08333.1 hypothetical protein MVES1_003705 [Malassezia vespertilionis]
MRGAPDHGGPEYYPYPPGGAEPPMHLYRDYAPPRGMPAPGGEPGMYPPMHERPMMHPNSPPRQFPPGPMRYAHAQEPMEPMDYMPMHPGGPPMLSARGRPPPLREDMRAQMMSPLPEPMPMPVPVDMPRAPMRERVSRHAPIPPAPLSPPRAGTANLGAPPIAYGAPDAPSASKRDRKRKEVLEKIERMHWEGMENRDAAYHEQYMSLSSTYHALLMQPSMVREYTIQLADSGLQRNETIRAIELYHVFLMERSQHTNAMERQKVEDEARIAKRNAREKLLHVIENRKQRLREEKDGGEFAADFLLDPSLRQQSTRQLRNKGPGAASTRPIRHALHEEDEVPTTGVHGIVLAVAQLLGWPEQEAAMAIAAAANTNSLDEHEHDALLVACVGPEDQTMRLSLMETFGSQASLLSGVNLTMQAAAAAANASKNKKKGAQKPTAQVFAADRAVDDDDATTGTGVNVTSTFIPSGSGRLRWDTAKCLSQLTGAKDFEVESDLINIHKIGTKRRRR